MEEPRGMQIRRNILNLYNYETLDEVIIEMINIDITHFEAKFKNQIESLRKTRFIQKGIVDQEILKVLKNTYDGPGDPLVKYIRIFEQEFFNKGEVYLEIFQEYFLSNIDFHFNIKRVYSIAEFNEGLKPKIRKLFLAAISNFTNQNYKQFKNLFIPSIATLESEYVHIEVKGYKVEILEKIGVIHRNNTRKIKTVFVKYVFDLQNNYFEIAYNEQSIRDLCTLPTEDKIITLIMSDENEVEEVFEHDSVLLGHLYTRVKNVFNNELILQSVSTEVTAQEFIAVVLSRRESLHSQIELMNGISENKEVSPYEAVLYNYFSQDKNKIITRVISDSSYENKKIEELIRDNFSEELDTKDLDASIRFLRNMTVFSKIKNDERLIERLDDYLFMFTVRDLAVTKSTTRNEERLPIYTSDFYWHLQEVIDSIQLLNEIGMRKTVEISDGSNIFQDLKILINGSFLTFTYFQNTRKKSFKKNPSSVLKLAEGRNLIHDQLKSNFREIISTESGS